MGTFWRDAESIFETATSAAQSDSSDCNLAILIAENGSLRLLDATGWSLYGLLDAHGAQTAYRVTREGGLVQLEGRTRQQTCLLRSETPVRTARQLLGCSFAHSLPAASVTRNPPLLRAPYAGEAERCSA